MNCGIVNCELFAVAGLDAPASIHYSLFTIHKHSPLFALGVVFVPDDGLVVAGNLEFDSEVESLELLQGVEAGGVEAAVGLLGKPDGLVGEFVNVGIMDDDVVVHDGAKGGEGVVEGVEDSLPCGADRAVVGTAVADTPADGGIGMLLDNAAPHAERHQGCESDDKKTLHNICIFCEL